MTISGAAERVYDVVVIGAGLSGLQAALSVRAAGLSVCVLEATDRVGGKTLSLQSCEKGVNDLGAAWINDTNQSEMFKLFQRYRMEGEIQVASGDNIWISKNGSVEKAPYGQPPDETTVRLFAVLQSESTKVDLNNPAASVGAIALDRLTFREFCTQQTQSESAVSLADSISASLLGVDSDEVSALYMLHYFKSGYGLENLVSDQKDGGQYLRNRQGNQTICQRMVVDLPPNTVFCQMPVVSIDQTRAHAPCAVQTASGVAFAGWRVIVSVPTTLYDTISFKPSLPSGKSMLSENTAMGYYSKMIFLFSEPWWRNAGLSGIFNADNGPVRFSRDTSVPSDNQWSITCFIVAERGRQWSKLSKAARRRQVWAQFSQAFGKFVDNLPAPTNILEIEWSRQAFFLGAPCPVMAPGVLTAVGTDLVTPFQNVHFVGTETATVWRGYMEGAVRSGQREGAKVVKSLKGITAKF